MRGYFGIGAEQISKPMNVGALFRTAHAFGASFVFTVDAAYQKREGGKADTSDTVSQLPFYSFPAIDHMVLPEGCAIVGVEITEEATELPSFRHPRNAAYVLGPERGRLSDGMLERCEHVVTIPTRFSINVSLAGALVMYDRLLSLGKFAERPLMPGGEGTPRPEHVHGAPVIRKKMEAYRDTPPDLD